MDNANHHNPKHSVERILDIQAVFCQRAGHFGASAFRILYKLRRMAQIGLFWNYIESLASDMVTTNDIIPESAILSDTKPDAAIHLVVIAPTPQNA
jgi:hypothetical protein